MEASLRRSEILSAMGSLVAGVAHEVRNPLFGISSILDAFEARFQERTDYQRFIMPLREELERLNKVMEDLLDYGKPFREELYTGALRDIVAHTVRSCTPLAERMSVRLVNNFTAQYHPVMMDRRRLPKVFINLLENAIRHSPPGATVSVEGAELSQNGQYWLDCVVKDEGPGFKAEDIPRLFEPFFSTRRGGTGLGLSIVQRIVEEHKGHIFVGNQPQGGACVIVRLPAVNNQPD